MAEPLNKQDVIDALRERRGKWHEEIQLTAIDDCIFEVQKMNGMSCEGCSWDGQNNLICSECVRGAVDYYDNE